MAGTPARTWTCPPTPPLPTHTHTTTPNPTHIILRGAGAEAPDAAAASSEAQSIASLVCGSDATMAGDQLLLAVQSGGDQVDAAGQALALATRQCGRRLPRAVGGFLAALNDGATDAASVRSTVAMLVQAAGTAGVPLCVTVATADATGYVTGEWRYHTVGAA